MEDFLIFIFYDIIFSIIKLLLIIPGGLIRFCFFKLLYKDKHMELKAVMNYKITYNFILSILLYLIIISFIYL
jgi:hypothetical protein